MAVQELDLLPRDEPIGNSNSTLARMPVRLAKNAVRVFVRESDIVLTNVVNDAWIAAVLSGALSLDPATGALDGRALVQLLLHIL